MLRVLLASTLVLGFLSGCASAVFDVGRTETVLPLSRAWIDGRVVEYVTTDVFDLAMATMMGVNHVPRLAEAARAEVCADNCASAAAIEVPVS